jgi:hypothetical protein
MNSKALEELVQHMENYIECWKQFNQFINLARSKKFGPEDENHFLEVKSVIVQELELIFAAMEIGSPTKEEVHGLVASAPSLRFLADSQEGVLRNIETQWHRIYLGWHAILGQLKVQQQGEEGKTPLAALFGKKNKK